MKVWVSDDVIRSMVAQARVKAPLETGGALLGWRDSNELVVTGLIGAGPAALHTSRSFHPDHQWQVSQIESAFNRTAGDLDYLGDWHSHPDGATIMSGEDRRTLIRISATARTPLMLILGLCSEEVSIACWTYEGPRTLIERIVRRVTPCSVKPFSVPDSWPTHLPTL